MQSVLAVGELPDGGIEASAVFHEKYLTQAQAALADDSVTALAITMPAAPSSHDDWRTALARDLARAHSPKRVNVVGGPQGEAMDAALAYLGDAQGVTGQYCPLHEA
ncbi:Rossmann fold domain-containing protein [Erythrobacter sp. MTPC3]|uniref:Rossmann fold domain-containing protein n=1 Tax=Erythrobacter sp. MTPC3 TaxID=3056564 RepID=UPI0036F2D4CC